MVEALWGQKMDFQSPGGLGTGQKTHGGRALGIGSTGDHVTMKGFMGKSLSSKTQGVQ